MCVVCVVLQAAEFRQFWGPKSEMRRFKDGKINESVGTIERPSLPSLHAIAQS